MNIKTMAVAYSSLNGSNILWGAASDGKLYFRIQQYGSLNWGNWQEEVEGEVPSSVMSITACLQNWELGGVNRLQVWAVDGDNVLHSKYQNRDGSWTAWVKNWNNAPLLTRITASEQCGGRGAQLWGIDTNGVLHSIYEHSPGTDWSPWIGNWENAPAEIIDITACLQAYNYSGMDQDSGRVQLWALTKDKTLHSIYQTSPGGDWVDWLSDWGPSGMSVIESANQGYQQVFNVFGGTNKPFGAQLWGAVSDTLMSCDEQKAGGDWSNWAKPWNTPVPGRTINTIASGGLNVFDPSYGSLFHAMVVVSTDTGALYYSHVNEEGAWSKWISMD